MPSYTPEEAERIGREAVALGMPVFHGYMDGGIGRRVDERNDNPAEGEGLLRDWPDPRDPITAKAFELWAEGVARKAYGPLFNSIEFLHEDENGSVKVEHDDHNKYVFARGLSSVPEACIALVRYVLSKEEGSP